jgi:hypothetical protein
MRVLGGPSVLTESSVLSDPCIAAAHSPPPSATDRPLATSGYLFRPFRWAAQRFAHQLRAGLTDLVTIPPHYRKRNLLQYDTR